MNLPLPYALGWKPTFAEQDGHEHLFGMDARRSTKLV
jgi:hypothetical protein